jgi:Fe-S-cluster containining protein
VSRQARSDGELDAGEFGAWVVGAQAALRGERDSEVPCGSCSGCCTSSQFVHVGPDEQDALAHIPGELLFPAPGLPEGHLVLGYEARGHCPMLVDGRCSIYEHRPRTCRTYDCRVFPAAGVELEEPGKHAIARQARRWVFRLPTVDDRRRKEAVETAAAYLHAHPEVLPTEGAAPTPTQRAVLAIEVHDAFLEPTPPPDGVVETIVRRRRDQESG